MRPQGYIPEVSCYFHCMRLNNNMAKQHNNFKKDIDLLAEAYGSMNQQAGEVVVESTDAPNPVEDSGQAAFKGGNIEHD